MRGKDAISRHLLLVTSLLGLAVACGNEPPSFEPSDIVLAARSAGAVPLTSADEFPASQRAAAEANIASIEEGGEDPGEFFAEVEREEGILIFHLWHESAFLPENQGMSGNPGGVSRDVHVDPASMEVVATLWWQ